MDILERFYYHFRIYPWATTTIKSLRRQPKIYLWDWAQVSNKAARLENLVAAHLLKFAHFLQDAEGYRVELNYLRDADGREVDFIVTVGKKPWMAVEVKQADTTPASALHYFAKRLKIPLLYQVVATPSIDRWQDQVRVMSATQFLSGLL